MLCSSLILVLCIGCLALLVWWFGFDLSVCFGFWIGGCVMYCCVCGLKLWFGLVVSVLVCGILFVCLLVLMFVVFGVKNLLLFVYLCCFVFDYFAVDVFGVGFAFGFGFGACFSWLLRCEF